MDISHYNGFYDELPHDAIKLINIRASFGEFFDIENIPGEMLAKDKDGHILFYEYDYKNDEDIIVRKK